MNAQCNRISRRTMGACGRAALAAAGVLVFSAAQAQTARFVSSSGSNTNNCTRTAPCRTLNRALGVSVAGGEVQILDSGTFGPSVLIRKSITISAAGVSATVGSVTIDAPAATVVLRGLLMSGSSASASTGVSIANALAVYIVDCQIERFFHAGINIEADNAEIFVANSAARSNRFGISSSGSGTRVMISNSRFENNFDSGVVNVGTQVTIENSVSSGNGRGVHARIDSIVRVSNSVVVNNTGAGFENVGGTFASRGNNMVSGNNPNVSGTITALGGI